MNKNDFYTYLIAASYQAVKFAEGYVKNTLHYNFMYDVSLNESCDEQAEPESDLYPEDNDKKIQGISAKDVIEILCRNDKVPEWIDISVKAVGKDFTLLNLLCCGRYTANKEKMYYSKSGQGPFGIKSPDLPFGYKDGQKFKIKSV